MAQGLLRKYPGRSGIVWIPGGPAGSVEAWDGLRQAILRSTGVSFLYCRFNSFRTRRAQDEHALELAGWRRPRVKLTTGLSLRYGISAPQAERLAACSANWRHNLKRSQKYHLKVERWESPDAAVLRSIYAEMEGHKQLATQFSEADLKSILQHFAERVLVCRALDAAGNLQAIRGCVVTGEMAWDLLAATAVAGRKTYASYAVFWDLIEECYRRGVREYDLSSVDPDRNKGVYDFKRGTGAAPVEYLGEWEWARPALLALPVNLMMKSRRGGM